MTKKRLSLLSVVMGILTLPFFLNSKKKYDKTQPSSPRPLLSSERMNLTKLTTATTTATKTKSATANTASRRRFSMPLESWHIILQWTAAILVGVTFLVGLATVWVGVKVNKEQAERIANLDLKRAEAEERIEELRKAQIRAKVGRWAFVGPLGEFVKGKPKGSAEVIFTPEDDEAFRTAMAIEAELSASGGWRITNNARPYSSDDILPRFSQGNPFNEPLLSRVGGLNSGLTVIISPADFDDETAFIKEGTAAHALYFGLISCGFEPLPNFDGRLQAGAVRIVVGQK